MSTQQHLWSALESVPGLSAVTAEWRALLGPEYESASTFLRPDGRLAGAYPCPLPQGCGCAHEVVQHGPDDIVAVCRCEPRRCEPLTLTRADTLIYEVNRRALGDAVAAALGAVPEHAAVPGLPATWSIGTYAPYAGFRFPVFLTIQIEPEALQRVVSALVARAETPFVLAAPTHNMGGSGVQEALLHGQAHFLALADDFVLDQCGKISARRPVEEVLAAFLSAVLPTPKEASSMVFFPTPPDATWEVVQIKFKDGHTVSIRVKEAQGVFNYTQMGMANSKNGDPTVQWDLLKVFARHRGTLDWSSPYAGRKNQKRKENLGANLRDFFRIDGDPFEVTERIKGKGKGWRARFALEPDQDPDEDPDE